MIKLEINIKKVDFSRARKGNVNPNNEYITLLVRKTKEADAQGFEYSVCHAQNMQERAAKAKILYVGKGKTSGTRLG